MTALRLAIEAKHTGAKFAYRDGRIVILNLECLRPTIRRQLEANLDDVLACVAEHSPPADCRPSEYVVDSATRIALEAKRSARA